MRIKTYFRIRILTAGVLVFLLSFISCQNVSEPTDVKAPITLQIRVMDQKRQFLEGASVEWAIKDNQADVIYSKLRNISTGIYQEVLPVPVIPPGILTYLRVLPPLPPLSNEFLTSLPILDTLVLCNDTVITYTFFREVVIDCADNCDEAIEIICNLDLKTRDTVCSKRYVNASNQVMTVNMPSPLPPEIRVEGFVGNNPVPQTGTLSVQPNEAYWFCFIYTPPGGNIAPRTTYFATITRDVAGQACLTCNLTIITEAIKLESCICPTFKQIYFPADTTTFYKICLADGPVSLNIPLNSIRNDNKDCDLIFTPVLTDGINNFNHPNLRISDFSGQNAANSSYIIKPGQTAMSLGIVFSPIQLGRFVAVAEYLVQTRNKLGEITNCPIKLTITFRGNVAQPICELDSTKSTLFKLVNGRYVIDTLYQCVGVHDFTRDRTLAIKNIGECDLVIDSPVENHSLFYFTPSRLTIKPGQSSNFTVAFIPTTDSVWPNGRINLPVKLKFNTDAIMDCNPNLVELWGIADTTCKYTLQQCLHHWGETQGNWYESIIMNRETNQITYSNDATKLGDRDIFVQDINVGAGSAILNTDYLRWSVVGQHFPVSTNETVCDFAYQYLSSCGSGNTGQMNISQWDVIAFEIAYTNGEIFCGMIWITAIENDKSLQGVPQVCMQICYPL